MKDFLTVSRKVPPGGYALVEAIVISGCSCCSGVELKLLLRVAVEEGGASLLPRDSMECH